MPNKLIDDIVSGVLASKKPVKSDDSIVSSIVDNVIGKKSKAKDPPGLQRGVRTLEGDVIDVQRTGMVPKVAGKIRGRVVTGREYVPGEKDVAGFGTMTKAQMTHDMERRKEIYGKARGVDPKLYRTLPGGELVYPGPGGAYREETPSSAPASIKKFGAKAVSDWPIIVAEAVGLASGGIPGMAVGAGVGEVIKRGIAKVVFGEKQTLLDDYVLRPVTTGVVSGAAGVAGKLAGPSVDIVNKALRGAKRTGQVGRIIKAQEKPDVGGTLKRSSEAGRFGIRPGTARITQSPLLAEAHTRYGKSPTEGGRLIREFDKKIEQDIKRTLVGGKGGLPKFAPPGTEWVRGVEARKTAGELYSALRNLRRAKAGPDLQAASKAAKGKVIDTTATLKTIDNLIKNTGVGGTKSLWREIKRDIKGKGKGKGKSTMGFGPLDEIRKKLMKRIDKTDPSRHGYDVSQGLKKIESVLRNDIGKVSGKKYHRGLKIYKAYSEKLRVFEDSLLNTVREMKIDQLADAGKTLLGKGTAPQAVGRMRRLITRRVPNGQAKWDKIMEGSLADDFKDVLSNLEVSEAKMRILKAGLPDKKYKAVVDLNEFIKTFQLVPKTELGLTYQAGQEVLEKGVGGPARLIRFLTPSPYIWSRERTEAAVERMSENVAKELISGDGVRKFLALKQISPDSKEFIKKLAGLFGSQTGRYAVGRIRRE